MMRYMWRAFIAGFVTGMLVLALLLASVGVKP